MGQRAHIIRGRRFRERDFVETVNMILIMCLHSEAHGLSPMVFLQASIQQRFTPGLNANSLSHPHNQIHFQDMVPRSMLPRLKKETYI